MSPNLGEAYPIFAQPSFWCLASLGLHLLNCPSKVDPIFQKRPLLPL